MRPPGSPILPLAAAADNARGARDPLWVDAVEKVFFVSSGSSFKSRWRANENIIWGDSSSGGELTGDFRSRTEGHRMAIAACFVFQQEISRSVF
jgi:hypothetical protein